MKEKINSFLYQNWDLLAAVAISFIGFICLFGWNVLDFNNINFVSEGRDFTSSYLGGVFYRLDAWRWPLLTHQNVAYPYGISVYGTDAGALLLLIFKPLHKFLGISPYIQFAGIWTLFCCLMQAYVSVLIFRHAFKNKFLILVSALFFVVCPLFLMRFFVHINLTCHFILLFAILMYLNNRLGKIEWIYMGVLTSLATLTCPYFLAIIYPFFILIWYDHWRRGKIALWPLLRNIGFLFLVFFFWVYQLGLFSGSQKISAGGWRAYAMDLAAPLSPVWAKSNFINSVLQNATRDSDAYVGLGVIILFVLVFGEVLKLFRRENLNRHFLLMLILIGFFMMALSPHIRLGGHMIFSYEPGFIVDWLGGIFRYSARFFWPIWYLFVYFALKRIPTVYGKKALWIIPVVFGMQVWDLAPTFALKHNLVERTRMKNYPLNDPYWEVLAKKYKNVFVFHHFWHTNDIWKFAAKYDKNVNSGYMNREPEKVQKDKENVRSEIFAGYVSDPDYFYVIDPDFLAEIKTVAAYDKSVQALYKSIKGLDGYYILEYDPAFLENTKEFKPQVYRVIQGTWEDDLVQYANARLYRQLPHHRDHATIVKANEEELVIKWDKHGYEKFKKNKGNNKYHKIAK
ncbi:MAG: DUF6311 domain-containing protein [Lactobacillales bacterium]|jgi:hypothetical protein|nr:DUF6311 domain-containing protein [Lactobacillales bacterium]